MNDSLINDLRQDNIRFVRIVWCDNANIIRAKAAHIDSLDMFIENGVGITVAQQALPVMGDSVVPETGLGPVGEVRLMPDWSTLKRLPYAPRHALVLSDMVAGPERTPWSLCPRNFLRRQVAALAAEGLHIKMAFENEFFLLSRTERGNLVPADDSVFAATSAMNLHCELINALADALTSQGLTVEGYYPESGPGQQELVIGYGEAMEAADRQVIYRETVRGIALNHGLIASFLPKIVEDRAGSGCHINISLWQGDDNITGDPDSPDGIGSRAAAFIAGLLEHLPGLTALTIPSKSSFRRIQPHFWAGAFTCWGYDNREAAVRVSRNAAGTCAGRFEFKVSDATANPYLCAGALVAAGLDGIRRELRLPEEVCVDPGRIPEAERRQRGIHLLPRNLGEAVAALERDEVLCGALGEDLSRAYLAIRRTEWEALKSLSLEEEVEMLAERY